MAHTHTHTNIILSLIVIIDEHFSCKLFDLYVKVTFSLANYKY